MVGGGDVVSPGFWKGGGSVGGTGWQLRAYLAASSSSHSDTGQNTGAQVRGCWGLGSLVTATYLYPGRLPL